MPKPYSGPVGPADWNEALDIISHGSREQSVEGMKVVCHELAQVTTDPESSGMNDIVKDADRLVSCLANKAIATLIPYFKGHSCGASMRPDSLKVDAQDIVGARFKVNLSGLPAPIFQHEYDHLQAMEKRYEEKTGFPSPERIDACRRRKTAVGFGKS